ncbi:hypothetical protein HY383_02190 [Candidatus Daviesbacteria bacterium]|nr:hypothetical protein [Candidatus Daviesbacteria bacterium]
MKKLLISLLLGVFVFSILIPTGVEAASRVKGYTKKNGTYVAPHYKTPPNKSKFDNFSTKGNINPYTGKKGTVNPYKFTPKKYKR